MNYNELENKYRDFIIYETESHSLKLNISNFRIDKYRGNHDEFVQYIVFILLRVKEANIEKSSLCEMNVDMKNVTSKHFHPFFLKKVLKPLNVMLNDPTMNEHVLGKIYIRNVGKYGVILWGILKPLFHKDTIAKMIITR
jgi:hypothetical protein